MEKLTLYLTLARNDTIIMRYLLQGEIYSEQVRLSFKPAGRDLVSCLKTVQQGS